MLKKMVNGVEIELTEQEEKNTLDFWALNDKYPEYVGCCAFDGLNPPYHDMEEVKKVQGYWFTQAKKDAMDKISHEIDLAMEDGKDLADLLAKRKQIRLTECPDFSDCKTVEDVKAKSFGL